MRATLAFNGLTKKIIYPVVFFYYGMFSRYELATFAKIGSLFFPHHWLSCFFICTRLNLNIGNNLKYILGDSWNYMPPILVPSSSKHIATSVLVIANLKKRCLWEAFCLWCHPSLQGTTCSKLAAETQEKNKLWKLFKIKNEDTRTMSVASF